MKRPCGIRPPLPHLLASVLALALALVLTRGAAAAWEEVVVFGPERFDRDVGAPRTEARDFAVPSQGQAFLLRVQNGSLDQGDLVSSAVVGLNGVTVFQQNDFRRNAQHLESPVHLGDLNRLEVWLASMPSSHLTVTVLAYYDPEDLDRDGDCDDTRPDVFPGAEEVCDGRDNDCDGIADNGCLADLTVSPSSIRFTGRGEARQLTVTGHYVAAGTADLTASSEGTFYGTSAPAVAGVSPEGLVTSEDHGEAVVHVSHGGFSAEVGVTVFLDEDGDGVPDRDDRCPGTAAGDPVDPWGCADAQLDDDGDGVSNAQDLCPGTPPGQAVDDTGCPLAPREPLPEGTFGKVYEDLIPEDATIGAYDPKRFSLVTGLVQDRVGEPLAGVKVAVHGSPQYGSALTDADGRFHLPMDGGATFTLSYEKAGLLTAHRQVQVPWNGVAVAETLAMLPADPAATAVAFTGNPADVVTHRGTPVTDDFGTRSATLVLTGDNRAWGRDAAGNEVELHEVTVRATEYDTPESMPAKLPPNTAYTYCAELAVDEAVSVRFEKPVVVYVDNFLGFDVGDIVPAGYYDRERAVWVPSENGVVVRLLDRNGDGVVDALDATGNGLPDDLDGSGSFADEVRGLGDAALYAAGKTYWRVEVTHFTPWDFNWPYGPPPGAIAPNPPAPPTAHPSLAVPLPGQTTPCTVNNSYTTPLDGTFHEDIPIPGTGMALHYASSRVPGRKTRITVPASGASLPGSLREILVHLEVAGRRFQSALPAAPNQKAEFAWDGFDVLGRSVRGVAMGKVSIGFVYEAVYYTAGEDFAQAFGQVGSSVTGIRARQELTVWKVAVLPVRTSYLGTGTLAEGWTLTPHHQSVPWSQGLFKGDGSLARGVGGQVIHTVAGTGEYGYSGDGAAAIDAKLSSPQGCAVDQAGNLYFADIGNHRIRKLAVDGTITTVAGGDRPGFEGDGDMATQSLLRFPTSVAVDAAGNLYIADSGNNRVRKVGKDGVIATVAGTGVRGYNGDGIQAKEADLTYPQDVGVDDAGNLYIVQNQEHRIRKVDPSGIITTVAGTGQSGYNGDGIQAISARLNLPGYVVIDTDGNIIIADTFNHRIRRVGIDGVIATIAGTGSAGYDSDEVPAGLARLNHPFSIALDENGNLYIADFENARIRKVGTDGIISTVAGIGRGGYGGDGDFAVAGELNGPRGIALDSDGNIYISDSINSRIRRVSPETQFDMLSGYPGHRVYATDGVAHVMGLEGEHRLSLDFVTGTPVQSFDYDESGQLTTVTDKDGNTTIIERGPDGVPTAIVSPDGLVTSLGIDGSRHLREVVYPDGSGYRFAYTADGRMTDVWDPNGNHFTHGFDDDGALTEVTDPEGGRWSYGHGVDAAGTIHTQEETGEGNVTSFRERTDFGGTYSRLTTSPFGADTAHTRAGDGRSVSEDSACGTRVELAYGLDPHYWHTVLQGTTTVLPSGLDRTVSVDRTYQDTDADGVPDRVTETVRVNGMPWTTVNDARSGTVTSTSPQGRTATAVYDPASLRALQLSVPGLLPVSYGYDARGRVETVTVGSRTTSLAYDANGYPAAAVTPDGRTIDYRFDVMGRLREEARPDGAVLQYDYDPNGNLTVLTTPRLHVHRFAYTANDQRRSYLAPLSGSYVYSYDTERNLQTVRSPSGRLLTNRYANGLLQSTQTPEGTVTYSHDCGGRISGAALGAESVSLTFDGPLLTSDTRHGTLSQTLSYGYDHDFRLTSLHYAGETETFGYDLDGLLVSAGELSVHRSAQNGLPEAVTGGAAELTRAFNGYGELDETAYVVAGRPVFQWQVGERDPAGRITRKVETIGGGTTVWEYLYDEAGRLTEVTKDAVPVETYSHDLNGNRTLEANTLRGIEARGYAYDAEDRVVTAGAEVYAFDEDGFLERKTTEAGTTTYTYSSRGELLRVDLPDGRVLVYDHDPIGRRVAKRVNGQIVEKYLWAGANRGLLAVYDGSDGLIARFRYADDRVPVAVTVAGQTYLLAADQLGTVRAVADTQGNVVKRIDYDTFGNVLYDSNPTFPLPLGFAGGLHDRDAGLVRFGARDYDPALGRWVAKDPIDFAGGDVVLYGYVAGDPVNFTDPDGLWVQYAASAVVGAASGALMVSLTTPNAPFSVYLAAAGLGAVSGLGAVHLGPGIFLQSMIGAGVGTAGYSATTILSGQKPNAAGICFAATGGAIGGAFSGLQSQNLAISLASTWISGVRGAAFGWLGHNLQQQVSAHPRSATIIP